MKKTLNGKCQLFVAPIHTNVMWQESSFAVAGHAPHAYNATWFPVWFSSQAMFPAKLLVADGVVSFALLQPGIDIQLALAYRQISAGGNALASAYEIVSKASVPNRFIVTGRSRLTLRNAKKE